MQPFFSIIIPTKNRPFYLRQAIQSVLWQNFDDYELIVSDNFNDENTATVISEFTDDVHFKSFRTDSEMTMCDHWEWASKKATGKFVLILPDRKLLFQHSLRKLHRVIIRTQSKYNVYSFAVRMYDEPHHKMGHTVPKKDSRIFSSQELIENFLTKNYYLPESYDFFFPKSLNSCYSNEWVQQFRLQYGNYFNQSGVTTPDYSSFLINVALNKEIYYFAQYLILTQGEAISTGRQISKGTSTYFEELTSGFMDSLPLKIQTSYNLIMNDFYRIKKNIGGNLTSAEPDLANYFATNYLDINYKKKISHTLGEKLEEEFNVTVSMQSEPVQHKIREHVQFLNHYEQTGSKLNWNKEELRLHATDFIYQRLKNFPALLSRLRLTFQNGLDAAGFKLT